MEYYISVNNEKRGPYSVDELKARGLSAETLVMASDSNRWKAAWEIEELRPAIKTAQPINDNYNVNGNTANGTANGTANRNANNAGATANGDYEEVKAEPVGNETFQQGRPVEPPIQPPYDHKKKSNGCLTGFLVAVIIILAIVGVAVVTCPSEDTHKAALTNVVAETVSDQTAGTDSTLSSDDTIGKMFHQISDSWSKEVVAKAVDNLIHVDNHVVFSTGKVRLLGKDHTVSVGVFGHIFTVDEKDLKAATARYYSKAEQDVTDDLKEKASEMIKQHVVDPAADALKGMIDDAFNDLFGGSAEPSDPDESTEQQNPESADSAAVE